MSIRISLGGRFFAQSVSESLSQHVAVMVTCRAEFWQERVSSTSIKEKNVATNGYDDAELQEVLATSSLDLSQIPISLRPLIRKPRYCDLVIKHFAAMVVSGDMSVDRLLYEDYKDKEQRKLNQPVTDEEFRSILCTLARRYHSAGDCTIRRNELNHFLPGFINAQAGLQEIIDGGLLISTNGFEPTYKVDPRRLVHGLGMLLAEHLCALPVGTINDTIDAIRQWLEPQPDMETKASIVGATVFFSFVKEDFPKTSRQALLFFWLTSRNLSIEQEETILAYAPECADDLATIADSCWETSSNNGPAQNRLANAFLKRREDPRIIEALIPAIKRWMSLCEYQRAASPTWHRQ